MTLADVVRVAEAIRRQYDTDPVGYWLSNQATPRHFSEWLRWNREAQAGRYHPAYV